MENRHQAFLQSRFQIDQHVSAANEIEMRKGRVMSDILPRKNASFPNGLADQIFPIYFSEVAVEAVRRNIFEKVVWINPRTSGFQRLLADIRAKEFHIRPKASGFKSFLNADGKRIYFLAGGTCWYPGSKRALKLSLLNKLREPLNNRSKRLRIAVGGGIWNESKMMDVARAGVTHVIDMQIEFDDTPLAEPYGVQVLWNATEDDFQPKSPELLRRGVDFALEALDEPEAKVFIHCAAGVHRAPMMTLALLCALGWQVEEAKKHIQSLRPVVDWAEGYVSSLVDFLQAWVLAFRYIEQLRNS